MSRIAELLARKRAADIKSMETGLAVDTTEIDRALADIDPPYAESEAPQCSRLKFSGHALRRMSQRGMSARDVYTV